MLNTQHGFYYKNINDDENFNDIYVYLKDGLKEFIDNYRVDLINLIQVYVNISDIPKLKLKNIDDLHLNKQFVNVRDMRYSFSTRLLPLSPNTNFYGSLFLGNNRYKYITLINNQKSKLSFTNLDIKSIDSMYLKMKMSLLITKKVNIK